MNEEWWRDILPSAVPEDDKEEVLHLQRFVSELFPDTRMDARYGVYTNTIFIFSENRADLESYPPWCVVFRDNLMSDIWSIVDTSPPDKEVIIPLIISEIYADNERGPNRLFLLRFNTKESVDIIEYLTPCRGMEEYLVDRWLRKLYSMRPERLYVILAILTGGYRSTFSWDQYNVLSCILLIRQIKENEGKLFVEIKETLDLKSLFNNESYVHNTLNLFEDESDTIDYILSETSLQDIKVDHICIPN